MISIYVPRKDEVAMQNQAHKWKQPLRLKLYGANIRIQCEQYSEYPGIM